MKLTGFLLFTGLMTISANSSFSQSGRVSIHLKNATLSEVFDKVEEQSNYFLFYKKDALNDQRRVTINEDDIEIGKLLGDLLVQDNAVYRVLNNTIVIVPKSMSLLVIDDPSGNQQNRKVTGLVLDANQLPIIGANVMIEGTQYGVVSDLDGRFSINVPEGDVVLLFSFVGCLTERVVYTGQSVITVTLLPDIKEMEEVVVVGYGVQKKVNLTGSVSSIDSETLENRSIANTITGLQGALPGVTIRNYTSRPGDSNTQIRIRGVGTLNNSDPLVLIDGVEGNLGTLNPADIESVSVLKDAASSAIYGSRAANGVMLITTRKAQANEKPTIDYNGYFALQMPTSKPEMLNAVEYLTLLKEATENVNKSWGYSQDDIDQVLNGTNPNYRANTNWVNELYKKSAPMHSHNLTINGGSNTTGYYLSYGYLGTDGLLAGDGYRATRHNARLKTNSKITDWLSLLGNVAYTDVDNWTPVISDGSKDEGLFYMALRSSPLVPVRFDDGQWGYGGSSANPVALAYDGGFINYTSQLTTINITGDVKLLKDLSGKVQYATNLTNVLRKQQANTIEHFYPGTEEHLAYSNTTSYLNQRDAFKRYQSIMAQLDYNKQIMDHGIHILGGFSQEWEHYEEWSAKRETMVSEDISVLDGGTENQTNSGGAYHWAIRSGFGRLNYNYAQRYLLEINARYDLSSRFHKDHRGGFFPSASVAWRLSEEAFMQGLQTWINNIKIRASYGNLGNQYAADATGNSYYPYLSTIGASSSIMPIGTDFTSGMSQTVASNRELSWESIEMINFGLDFSLFKNRLSFTGEYFIKNTRDILLKVNLPDVLGVDEPYQNAGKVQNKGWELSLSWQDRIENGFSYGLNINLSDVKNKVISMGDVADDFSGDQIKAVDYPINAFWGFVADGLHPVEDFDYNPGTNTYTIKSTVPVITEYKTKLGPGDIKYKDLNNDGVITKADDRKYIGSAIPRYTFAISGNAEWKGIDFQFFIQGVGKCNGYINSLGRHAFTELANYPQKEHLDRFTLENQNIHASYPRFTYEETYNQNNYSTFWIENAAYIRLKNVQMGYTLPSRISSKVHVQKCRLYISGENLLTVSDFFYAYDPEVPVSRGGYYPVVKTVSLGVRLTVK